MDDEPSSTEVEIIDGDVSHDSSDKTMAFIISA